MAALEDETGVDIAGRDHPCLATIDGVAAFLSAATDLGPSALSPVGGRDHDEGMDEPANTSVEWLDRDECLRLLAADEVGRLAVVVGHAPMIVPVNYRLDGDRVVFRSDPGTKVDYGLRSPVAFEIDGIDRAAHTGWSVVVTGRHI